MGARWVKAKRKKDRHEPIKHCQAQNSIASFKFFVSLFESIAASERFLLCDSGVIPGPARCSLDFRHGCRAVAFCSCRVVGVFAYLLTRAFWLRTAAKRGWKTWLPWLSVKRWKSTGYGLMR